MNMECLHRARCFHRRLSLTITYTQAGKRSLEKKENFFILFENQCVMATHAGEEKGIVPVTRYIPENHGKI